MPLRIAVEPLASKLVPPGSRPPPESVKEISDSNLLERANKVLRLTVFSDGAFAWPKNIQDYPHLRSASVCHKRSEFVKVVPRRSGSSTLAGTQSIDQRWRLLDAYIPSTLKTKLDHRINPSLYTYVYSWVWRHNLGDKDIMTELGKLFRA